MRFPAPWHSMESAPKDGSPILAWCDHEADHFIQDEETGYLTTYTAHSEGYGQHAQDGYQVVAWGGEYRDKGTWEEPQNIYIPDWWFVHGSDWEIPANPICWAPLPEHPLL